MIRRQRDYPRQLQIGDNIWDVVFCREIKDEPASTLGLMDPSDCTIYIRMGQTPEERFKTFAHEICHAVCYEFKIEENHRVIHNLEEPILRFLIDNGLVF